jgi:2-(1,2-epoxy-1,2-dihydrophenyl)acetyl-CoA isomerase
MTELETVKFEIVDGVGHITLNRPDKANAMNPTMARELLEVAITCDEDGSVRCVLIDAVGKMFCAGGDLAEFSAAGDGMPRLLKEMTVCLHAAIGRLARMRPPVVGAVGGTAAGAGFSLVTAIDLPIAARSARFTMAYTRAGLTPDGSSTYFLPRLIGRRRTLELMITNRLLTADEALEWGILSRVVADEELDAEAWKLARQIASGPTLAYGAVKDLVLRSDSERLESQMEHEARAIADAARTADAKEGIAAFFDKRAPEFGGK